MKFLNKELLDKYDEIVNAAFIGIYGKSLGSNSIKLKDIVLMDDIEMLLVHVASMVSGVYNKSFEVCDLTWWERLFLKLHLGKAAKVVKTKDNTNAISIHTLALSMLAAFDKEDLTNAYKTYFTKKGRKQFEN